MIKFGVEIGKEGEERLGKIVQRKIERGVGSEIVLWKKVYTGFVVRTLGRFPQRTEGWCD